MNSETQELLEYSGYCGHPRANILWLHYRGWLYIMVHNTLAISTLGPNKVALLESGCYSDHIIEGSTVVVNVYQHLL